MRSSEPRQRIKQDDDVFAMLHESLRLLDNHVGDLNVTVGRLVECRADDFSVHIRLHIGDFFRPLVDQQHDEGDLRMILSNRVGDFL